MVNRKERAAIARKKTETRREVAQSLVPMHLRLIADLNEASSLMHAGEMGANREQAVRGLLAKRLPGRFGVTHGEVIDLVGRRSKQLDVIIFDRLNYVPLVGESGANGAGDSSVVIPVEAILAVVEVKSKLDAKSFKGEVGENGRTSPNVMDNASSVFRLRPGGKKFARARSNGAAASTDEPRIHYSVVALESGTAESSWPNTEARWARDWRRRGNNDKRKPWITSIAALDRGIIFPDQDKFVKFENPESTVGFWYFSLLSFLTREIARRPAPSWSDYQPAAKMESSSWGGGI